VVGVCDGFARLIEALFDDSVFGVLVFGDVVGVRLVRGVYCRWAGVTLSGPRCCRGGGSGVPAGGV